MSRGLFITGTGTEVGKTVISAGILRMLRSRGINAIPMKPVQTGAEHVDGKLSSPDLEFSLQAAGLGDIASPKSLLSSYRYEPACSPHLAGRLSGNYPNISHIKNCTKRLMSEYEFLVVEGAGGIMVPLDESRTMLDLMKTLAYPVIIVASTGLGTINHTLLSIRALKDSGLKLLGIVFCNSVPVREEDQEIVADNPTIIERFGDVKNLGVIRYFDDINATNELMWLNFESDLSGFPDILKGLGR